MRNGGAAHKNNEAPRSFDSISRRRHFERKREIFFVCGHERNGRASENGKHGTPYALGSRRFIREGNSERSTKSSLGGVYEERLFVIAMFFFISNFPNP